MSRTTNFKGEPLSLGGKELKVGDRLPRFTLTGNDMKDVDESILSGKPAIILSVPSLDTPVCAVEGKRFNQEAAQIGKNLVTLIVSRDLPFAQKRYCGAEGINNVITASDYKHRGFGEAFGTHLQAWDLLSRAVFVVDPQGVVRHVEYVSEVSSEPNYDEALTVAREYAA
jgi:thioredoxin-dependent peroxiredoxin